MRKVKEEEEVLRVMQRDSKEGNSGMDSLEMLRQDLKMNAMPPPDPVRRGLCMMEYQGGVRELRTEGGDEAESQVSVIVRMSRDSSKRKSARRAGLSKVGVTEVADLVLRWAKLRVGLGPGLEWTSPERSRRRRM